MLDIVALAVAVKVAVVAPAFTVTEAGTVSRPVLLPNVTVAPPAGAVWVSVVVQLEVPPPLKLPGVHDIRETAGTTMLPPPAPIEGMLVPVASTPIGLMRPIDVVGAVGAKVT